MRLRQRRARAASCRRDVASPRITSTSCITGTGFMKCIPITRSGRFVRAGDLGDRDRARVRREDRPGVGMPIEIGEDPELELAVLGRGFDDERRAAHGVQRRARRDAAEDRVALLPPASVPFLTWRSRFFSIVAVPGRARPSATSIIVTGKPCCANTCAMPFPICPAPITAMRSLTCLRLLAASKPRSMEIEPAPRACRAPRRGRLPAPIGRR